MDEALDIAGSRQELERVRDKKTVQNWMSKARKNPKAEVVPAAALVELLLDRFRGKRVRVARDAEELRLALDDMRELYARTRGNTDLWKNAYGVIHGLIGGVSTGRRTLSPDPHRRRSPAGSRQRRPGQMIPGRRMRTNIVALGPQTLAGRATPARVKPHGASGETLVVDLWTWWFLNGKPLVSGEEEV
jgi:hypothetical protein